MKKKLSDTQKELLKILKVVKILCEKNKIRYYAIGGTALGAIRHNGFIPWDDDIDLGIHIEDYEKFINICKKLPSPYKFIPLNFMGGKIYNPNTTFLEAQCIFLDKKSQYGIFVDIFPIIGIPNEKTKRELFLKELRQYHSKAFIFDRYPNISKLSKKEITNWKNDLLHRYKIQDSKSVIDFSTGFNYTKDASGLSEPLMVKFENTAIPVPSSFDSDLTNQYGDYQKLPAVQDRHTHDDYTLVDIKRPISYYQEKICSIDSDLLELLKLKDNQEGSFLNSLFSLSIAYDDLAANNKSLEKRISELTQLTSSKTNSSLPRKIKQHLRHLFKTK